MNLKQIYLSKTAAAGCLFKKFKKNKKKVKTQKHKNNSRIAIRLLSHHQTHFLMNRIVYCTLQIFIFVNTYYSTFSQWCTIFLISMPQKSKLISHVSKFGPMPRITPTFLARMLRVWPLFCLLVFSCLTNIGEY